MPDLTASMHIVRRYGQVGGMERYVWELTHALSEAGQKVTVLCEKAYSCAAPNIQVIELGQIKQKPRWISMLRFSARVSNYLSQHPLFIDTHVIHSHERTAVHQVTTFHGPPIKSRKSALLDCLSPRLLTWDYLEKRELCGPQVQAILPNSDLISTQLNKYYPEASAHIRSPAYPAVADDFFQISKKAKGKVIGFIGKEWKRKGLDIAIELLTPMLHEQKDLHFIIAGPPAEEIQSLFTDWPEDRYSLIGWSSTSDFLREIDVLIHPARIEPFGMVVAESNAAGIPVIISDHCGIAPLIKDSMGKVISIQDKESWMLTLNDYLNEEKAVEKLTLTWAKLAQQHIKLYTELK